MKKIIITLTIALLLMGCVYAGNSTISVNGVDFNLPSKYQGGEIVNGNYRLENVFSISCIDDDVAKSIGLWAEEKDFSQDLMVGNHPVRHYCQYNKYVSGNQSHAYFASGESVYEIKWTGSEIDKDIEKLIEKTPESKIESDAFYTALDKSFDIYKNEKIDKLNQEGQYNYMEAKYQSQAKEQTHDDTRFKEILLTYYNR